MAVTVTPIRTGRSVAEDTITDFGSLGLTGTYVQGGFTWYPLQIPGTPGSSPSPSSAVIDVSFRSLLGYIYSTVITTSGLSATAVTKILSAANTEIAAGALPEASVGVVVVKTKR